MNSVRAATVLERAIARAQQGTLTSATVLWTLVAGEIVFLSTGPVEPGVLPADPFLLNDGSSTFLALFTHGDRATPFLEEGRSICGVIGMHLLSRLPDGVGIVVNPGSKLGFEVPAAGVQAFVQDLLSTTVEGV